jgi:hypothetical protein
VVHWSPDELLDLTAEDLRFWVKVLDAGGKALKAARG